MMDSHEGHEAKQTEIDHSPRAVCVVVSAQGISANYSARRSKEFFFSGAGGSCLQIVFPCSVTVSVSEVDRM